MESISDHWDSSTSSWSIFIRRMLNDEEIINFQSLLFQISSSQPASSLHRRFWSLETSGSFSIKSLVKHLSTSSPFFETETNFFINNNSMYKRNIQ